MPVARPGPTAADPDELEAAFYEALRHGDLERLMSLWADDDAVLCVHPGGPRHVGPAAVRAAFAAVFERGGIPVEIEQVQRLQGPGCELHHLVERITVPGDKGPVTAWVLASNLYLRTPQGWRLAAHHASPGLAEPPRDAGRDLGPATLH